MRILLAENSLYYPSHGGGEKSNRLLMEALAARGHEVRVSTRVERFGPAGHEKLAAALRDRGIAFETTGEGTVAYQYQGVDVRALALDPHLRAFFKKQVGDFRPEIIITSTDDPAQLLFELAVQAPDARVVYLVRATIAVPFGPEGSSTSVERTARLRQADIVVGVSNYVAAYCRKWGGLDAIHVPISLLEPGRPEILGRFDNPYVVLVNPCAVKGIDIFLGLADRMPSVAFAGVPTWGTTAHDLEEMRKRPNIRILEPVDKIDELLRLTRVMLVPSVWAEARSRMILEAVSRGIPVIASDVGGIKEAMMGLDYLLPVNQVTGYRHAVDDHMVPVAEVPAQDVSPWVDALHCLTSDPQHWAALSRKSRAAALNYMEHLNVLPFEGVLEELLRRPKRGVLPSRSYHHPLEDLSDDKKKLLALRLKKRGRWFVGPPRTSPDRLRLFCFPYAGAGTLPYKSWEGPLRGVASISSLRLPGREDRLSEPPIETMAELVRKVAEEIEPLLDGPFAFFGHSMGAIIAYELAVELRRRAKVLPVAIVASAARAPQFRLNHVPPPPPSDDELLREVERLQGAPNELLRLALPALKADTRLYSGYVHTPQPPLGCRIYAYGGDADPNITIEHLSAWSEVTTAEFRMRLFPGGHFYIQTGRDAFLAALAQDLCSAD